MFMIVYVVYICIEIRDYVHVYIYIDIYMIFVIHNNNMCNAERMNCSDFGRRQSLE